jgi:hypothetical protein
VGSEYTDNLLKKCAGNISCLSEFRPCSFPSAQTLYKFMHSFYKFNVCCFLSGTLFSAGILDSLDGLTLFTALIHCHLLYFIFQEIRSSTFMVDDFTFHLVHAENRRDIFHYMVTFEDYNMPMTVVGIDTTKKCGPLSNIDFVHFVWQNFLRFRYKKYAMVLSPRGSAKLPKLLCLKYY